MLEASMTVLAEKKADGGGNIAYETTKHKLGLKERSWKMSVLERD